MDDFFRDEAEDFLDYLDSGRAFLANKNILVEETGDKKILQFTQTNRKKIFINTDSLTDLWGIILFDVSKEPLIVNMDHFKKDVETYFPIKK